VLVQRFNAVLLHDSLPVPDCTDWASYHFSLFSSIIIIIIIIERVLLKCRYSKRPVYRDPLTATDEVGLSTFATCTVRCRMCARYRSQARHSSHILRSV